MLNLGWLSVALLAAWCIGRPYGLGPQALIGASVALGSQSLVEFQAGEALNDITGVAFVLAAAAILVNGYAARAAAGAGPSGSAPETPRNVKRFASNIPGTVAGPDPDTPAGRPARASPAERSRHRRSPSPGSRRGWRPGQSSRSWRRSPR